MEVLDKIGAFINGDSFFWWHGYGLTALWIVASTIGILAKKVNIYLHALMFFIIDVSTVFLVGGAFYRYLPRFATFTQWTIIRQLHIFGGIFVLGLIILQHIGGVSAILSASKKSPQHKKFAFWVANLARVVVVGGWMYKIEKTNDQNDRNNLFYVSIGCAILLVASFYNSFILKHSQTVKNPEQVNGQKKQA